MKEKIINVLDRNQYKILMVLTTVQTNDGNLENIWEYISKNSSRKDNLNKEDLFTALKEQNFVPMTFENTVKENDNEIKDENEQKIRNVISSFENIPETKFQYLEINSDNDIIVNGVKIPKENIIDNMIPSILSNLPFSETLKSVLMMCSGVTI